MRGQARDGGRNHHKWRLTKDSVLTSCGLLLIGIELLNAEFLGHTFHPEFLLAGLALCGIGIAQGIDRRDKE